MASSYLLNSGASIPAIGLGTILLGAGPEKVKDAVPCAIEEGYTHFDTASNYGSEAPLGEALSMAFKKGLVKREDVFVTSKLWCDAHDPNDVIHALQSSLRALQLDYLDLYLIHFPVKLKKGSRFPIKEEDFLPVDIKSTWGAMEKCAEQGLTKSIGVSNFSSKKLKDLFTCARIPPAVNQVEMHPVWQQKKLLELCNNIGVHVCAWSPLGAPGTPYGGPVVLENPVIKEIANKHGKTPAQVALRWGLDQGVTVLPKSYNKQRIKENFSVFDWQLTEEDIAEISTIEQKKLTNAAFFVNSTTSPYKSVEEFWDGEI